jgi:competence protein ComEA
MNAAPTTLASLSLPPPHSGFSALTPRRVLLTVLALLVFTPWLSMPAAAGDQDSAPAIRVNINAASSEELQFLPGVGESRAQAILALRKQRGEFKSLEELLEVKGIGDASLARMEPHLTLSGKTIVPQ